MVEVKLFLPENEDLMPLKKSYLYRAGFKGKNIVNDNQMCKIVNSIYMLGLELAEPKIYYNTFDIKELDPTILPDSFRISEKITLFASTLGADIDKEIQTFSDRDLVLKVTLLDAWASEALERINRTFDKKLRDRNQEGTRRFSPGYGNLDIRVNNRILDILDIDEIEANPETGIITPRKSTICMIGWK